MGGYLVTTLSKQERELLLHLASLARRYSEPMDYPKQSKSSFPQTIFVSQAVCHPECGTDELIVDGSTQECQNCGGIMFRLESAAYQRVDDRRKRK
ncbi:MAG: hypothetical protein OEY28_13190 [Nitrospira sp.]|nr:hypothetical protein [Nitrospira sp.]